MILEIGPPHEFFLSDPKLALQGLPDIDLHNLHTENKLVDRPESKWCGVYLKQNMIAVLRMEPLGHSVSIHAYIATKYQQMQLLKYIFIDTVNYLKEHTSYTTMVIAIPEPCTHVVRTMKPLGFKYMGTIKNQLIWRNATVNLLHYSRKI
jgi:hypothetical protein